MVMIDDERDFPAAIDLYLLSLGFYKSERQPGTNRNVKVALPKKKDARHLAAKGISQSWTPSYIGEEPPH